MVKKILIALSLIPVLLSAQQETLNAYVNEINQLYGLQVKNLYKYQNKILFLGSPYVYDYELYIYDPISKKTNMVKDILPGNNSPFTDNKEYFVTFGNKVYFTTYIGSHTELWVTDGTNSGTQKIFAAPDYEGLNTMIGVNGNKLIFNNGRSLYFSDGTTEGTKLLKKFNESGTNKFFTIDNYFVTKGDRQLYLVDQDGNMTSINSLENDKNLGVHVDDDFNFYNLNGTIIHYAQDLNAGSSTYGLWKFNKQTKKSELLYNVYGAGAANIINNKLVVNVNAPYTGSTMLSTDGSKENTFLLSNKTPFVGYIYGNQIAKLGNYLYFFSTATDSDRNKLWRTDGTKEGTQITDIAIDAGNYPNLSFSKIFTDNKLAVIENSGTLKWLIDDDLNVKAFPKPYLDVNNSIEVGNKIIFPYSDDINGNEIFQYDFVTNSVNIYADTKHNTSSFPKNFSINPQQQLIFTAKNKENQYAFFSIDDKLAPVKSLGNYLPTYSDSNDTRTINVGNFTYLKTEDDSNYLVRTNGTKPTEQIVNTYGKTNDNNFFANLDNENLVFTSNGDDYKLLLCKINNNSDQIEVIKEFPSYNYSQSGYDNAIVYNNEIYFVIKSEDNKSQIWKTDGTSGNTKLAFSIPDEDYYSNYPQLLTIFEGKLIITKNYKLYTYNANSAQVALVTNGEYPFNQISVSKTEVFDNKLYIATTSQVLEYSNLIDESKVIVNANSLNGKINFLKCNSKLVISAGTPNQQDQMWSYNPVTGITKDIIKKDYNTNRRFTEAVCVKDYLYFSFDDAPTIYRNDTNSSDLHPINVLFNDENPAATDRINKLISYKDNLYFVGTNAESGTELFTITTELPVFLSTSESELDQNKQLKIILYPNPASDFIKISTQKDLKINTYTVYNMAGQQVNSGIYTPNKSINVNTLQAGNYIIQIKTESSTFSQKFIKK